MDITSANAKVVLTVDDLFPAGILLEKFSTDQSVTADEETFGEIRMGVDGKIAGGYTPTPKPVTIMLEADSPSLQVMEQVIRTQESLKKLLKCNLTVSMPSIGRRYNYTNGMLISGTVMPGGKKVLEPSTFKFQFEDRKPQAI